MEIADAFDKQPVEPLELDQSTFRDLLLSAARDFLMEAGYYDQPNLSEAYDALALMVIRLASDTDGLTGSQHERTDKFMFELQRALEKRLPK